MTSRLGRVLHRRVVGKSVEDRTETDSSRQAHEEQSKNQHRNNVAVQRAVAVAPRNANRRENPVEDRVEERVRVEQHEVLHRLLGNDASDPRAEVVEFQHAAIFLATVARAIGAPDLASGTPFGRAVRLADEDLLGQDVFERRSWE